VFERHADALFAYRPSGDDLAVHAFCAETGLARHDEVTGGERTGAVTHRIPGDHYSIMRGASLRQIAARLHDELAHPAHGPAGLRSPGLVDVGARAATGRGVAASGADPVDPSAQEPSGQHAGTEAGAGSPHDAGRPPAVTAARGGCA